MKKTSRALDSETQAAPAERRKRVRLSPEVRSRQLLDSALIEFSQHGYLGARIEDIGRRIGLSKSGVYAHYRSKEEIFEALLNRVLRPLEADLFSIPDDGESLEAIIDRFIDMAYERLADPSMMSMLRLMIAESVRVPGLIQRWYGEVVLPYHQAQERILQKAVASGALQRSALTENFALVYAPAVYASLMAGVHQGQSDGLPGFREAHRQMVHALLKAP